MSCHAGRKGLYPFLQPNGVTPAIPTRQSRMQDGCTKATFETLHIPDGFIHLSESIHTRLGVVI